MQSIFRLLSIECLGECAPSESSKCCAYMGVQGGTAHYHGDGLVETCDVAPEVKGVKSPKVLATATTSRLVELDCSGKQYAFKSCDALGEGSYGCVYLGMARSGSKNCAIKHIPKANPLLVAISMDEDENKRNEHVKALRQEVRILKTLSHPNIIRLIDSSEDFRNLYLVLEYCSGGKLTDFINSQKVKPNLIENDASRILQQLLAAVQYLHGMFFCHRDIKPDNVMLESTGPMTRNSAKLIDFGLACECRPGQCLRDVAGTPLYMSPQVMERRYDLSADIWSCGVATYELLSGRAPFRADTRDGVLKLVQRGNYAFNGEEWYHISDSAKAFIRGMMTYMVKDRWSAEEAAAHAWVAQHSDRVRQL